MKPSVKSTFGFIVGACGLMLWAQVANAQSGNRTNGFQPAQAIPQQQFSAPVETYRQPLQLSLIHI